MDSWRGRGFWGGARAGTRTADVKGGTALSQPNPNPRMKMTTKQRPVWHADKLL